MNLQVVGAPMIFGKDIHGGSGVLCTCGGGSEDLSKYTLGKGTLLGTPNSRYIIGIYLPGSLYSIIFLLYSWGSLFGVPSRVPLLGTAPAM